MITYVFKISRFFELYYKFKLKRLQSMITKSNDTHRLKEVIKDPVAPVGKWWSKELLAHAEGKGDVEQRVNLFRIRLLYNWRLANRARVGLRSTVALHGPAWNKGKIVVPLCSNVCRLDPLQAGNGRGFSLFFFFSFARLFFRSLVLIERGREGSGFFHIFLHPSRR